MATALYTIVFQPTPGSIGTLIEYKENSASAWITPVAPPNPTTLDNYPLYLELGKFYTIRVSADGVNCTKKYIYVFVPVGECCPVGYTLSDDATYCFKDDVTAATPPSASENAAAVSDPHFSMCGSRVMNAGYTINGTGTYTVIPSSIPFWINDGGFCTVGSTTAGPMNRNAIWSTTPATDNQVVGFTFCLTVTTAKTYYIGMSFDNYGQLSIDGNTIILTDNSSTDPLKNWCIYPVFLTVGNHVIEIVGINGVSAPPNPGAIAVEIYNNTRDEILASTGYGTLNVIFKTADYVGQPIQIGSGGLGYTCPTGYSLVLCDGPAYCTKRTVVAAEQC